MDIVGKKHIKGWLKVIIWAVVWFAVLMVVMWGWARWREKKLQISYTEVLYDTTGMRSGDLVFRNGLAGESLVVTSTSNSDYSHVGIAYNSPDGWMVIHAVPGEAPKGQQEYMVCEPISVFYNTDRAMAGATARVDCDSTIALAAMNAALKKREDKVIFDNDYNTADSTQIYCSELVWLAYKSQGIDLLDGKEVPKVIYPEDIWTSQHVKERKKFDTRKKQLN